MVVEICCPPTVTAVLLLWFGVKPVPFEFFKKEKIIIEINVFLKSQFKLNTQTISSSVDKVILFTYLYVVKSMWLRRQISTDLNIFMKFNFNF